MICLQMVEIFNILYSDEIVLIISSIMVMAKKRECNEKKNY